MRASHNASQCPTARLVASPRQKKRERAPALRNFVPRGCTSCLTGRAQGLSTRAQSPQVRCEASLVFSSGTHHFPISASAFGGKSHSEYMTTIFGSPPLLGSRGPFPLGTPNSKGISICQRLLRWFTGMLKRISFAGLIVAKEPTSDM